MTEKYCNFTNISMCLAFVVFISKPVESVSNTTHGLEKYLKVCHLLSTDLEECIKDNILSLQPKFAKGIPELNISKCEPLSLPSIEFKKVEELSAVQSSYKDINVWGATNFSIQSVQIDTHQHTANFQINIPRLYFEAKYEMKGKIYKLDIDGKGDSTANYTNINATVFMEFEKEQKDGKTYVQCKDVKVELVKIGGISIHFDNLFGENKELGKTTNQLINYSAPSFADELKPVLQTTIAGIFKDLTNKLCDQQPIDAVFPN